MKYSKKCAICNAMLEVSYDYFKDDFIVHNNSQTMGEIEIDGKYRRSTEKESGVAFDEEEVNTVKTGLKEIMTCFQKRCNAQKKVLIVLQKYCIDKELSASGEVLQKSGEQYYSFTYIIYSEDNSFLASKCYIAEHFNKEWFLECLIEDYCHLLKSKVEFTYCYEDVMLSSEAGSKFFHEFIGHLLEEDHFAISPIRDRFHSRVFCENLNILENVDVAIEYDDCGNPIQKNICLVERGIIVNLLTMSDGPHGYECNNSGNGIVNYYSDRFIPRMRSVKVTLPKACDANRFTGILIEDFDACEMNPIEGMISFTVNKSYTMKDGEKGQALERFTFHMSIFDLLDAKITAVGKENRYIYYCVKNNQKVFTKCECNSMILKLKGRVR